MPTATTSALDLAALPAFFGDADLDLELFRALIARESDPAAHPHAASIEKNVPIYDGDAVRAALADPAQEASLRAEWCRVLRDGAGVLAIQGAFSDPAVIDRNTEAFQQIVAQELAAGGGDGDHFGNNQRIWNALQKVGLHDPEAFVDYYGNPVLALAATAWLGPGWQMTAQMNNVRPGSSAQSVHRDYHLGFQGYDVIAQYPAHLQVASQYLTLQGAVAHSDMPLETGPTRLLPFSQLLPAGYLADREEAFVAAFEENFVQLPLAKGDAVFFSPALFHGAGTNQSSGDRIANLLQISSSFGRPMELVNRDALLRAVFPVVQRRRADGTLTQREADAALTSAADGYSFPTNLDSDPPIGGNAPETALQMATRAVDEGLTPEQLGAELDAYAARRRA